MISRNVPLLKIRTNIIKLADINIAHARALFCFHGNWHDTCVSLFWFVQKKKKNKKKTHFQLQFIPKASSVERDQ